MARRPITSRPVAGVSFLLLAGLLGLPGCGGPSERDRVTSFVEAGNEVQGRAAPALRRANAAYQRFAQGKLPPRDAVDAMEKNQEIVSSLRADVAALDAPPRARRLKELLLRVFDASAEVAEEMTVTATYLVDQRRALAGLGDIARDLRSALRSESGGPAEQARGLSRYARGLSSTLERLRRLEPPLILEPEHRAHVRRLIDSRTVATRLRSAILERDQDRVVTLLDRLGEVNVEGPQERLTRAARRAYERLLRRVELAQRAVQTEVARLDRALG